MDADEIAAFQMAGQDIPWLLAHWAGCQPDHPLLIWEPRAGSGRQWTYAEFWHDVRSLAAGLAARGVTKGDKVLIHSDNCPEMMLTWYACAVIGAVGVTTNNRSVAAEITYYVDKANCVAAVTQPKYAALIAEAAGQLKWIAVTEDNGGEAPTDVERNHGLESFASLFGDADAAPRRTPEPLLPVGIMFTSGTTSKPKAVVHTHANMIWTTRVGPRNIDLFHDDVFLVYLPLFHANAQNWCCWTTLGVGATIVLQPKFSASRFWEVVAARDVTHISVMPFVMKGIAGQTPPPNKLRAGVYGALCPPIPELPGVEVYGCYGMTETVIHALGARPVDGWPIGTMGHPTPGYQVAIVDQDTGALCADGEPGELWLRGTRGIQLFLEYFDNPEANAKAFTDDGWFRTGDIVRMGEGGCLFYVERDKDLLKVGGENVSAREVEDVCRTVRGVEDVTAVGKTHPFLDQVVVVFVVTDADAPDDAILESQVIAACQDKLADFKVPRALYVVDDFPRATLEKVAKHKLRELADTMPAV